MKRENGPGCWSQLEESSSSDGPFCEIGLGCSQANSGPWKPPPPSLENPKPLFPFPLSWLPVASLPCPQPPPPPRLPPGADKDRRPIDLRWAYLTHWGAYLLLRLVTPHLTSPHLIGRYSGALFTPFNLPFWSGTVSTYRRLSRRQSAYWAQSLCDINHGSSSPQWNA